MSRKAGAFVTIELLVAFNKTGEPFLEFVDRGLLFGDDVVELAHQHFLMSDFDFNIDQSLFVHARDLHRPRG